MGNTVNICVGHLPFPEQFGDHVDLMISPHLVVGPRRLAIVPDSYFGPSGSALSEYVQLMWLYDNLDAIAAGKEYVRLFQYRRFASRVPGGNPSTNQPWSSTLQPGDLSQFAGEFDRNSTAEVFNTPHEFEGGALRQYASAHLLVDMLGFCKFLMDEGIFDAGAMLNFLGAAKLIPACNIGVFRLETLRDVFSTLRRAAKFLESPLFVERTGYQRRSMGFLTERLASHLIMMRIARGASEPNFGYNMVISDGPVVSITP